MDTIRDLADGWIFIRENLNLVIDDSEREKYNLRLEAMIPKFLDSLEARLKAVVHSAANGAAAPAPKAPLFVVKDDYSYDDFASLFEKYGRNVADSLRVWFKDVEGGFDSSTVENRVDLYAKAATYLDEKSKSGGFSRPAATATQDRKPARIGKCPEEGCDASRKVTTKYGEKWRCDDHDWWGKA